MGPVGFCYFGFLISHKKGNQVASSAVVDQINATRTLTSELIGHK